MSNDRQEQEPQQISSKNYFISTDFFLRTILFFITLLIIILQHALTLCDLPIRFSQQFFTPSFGTNSWSATGLYVTCWTVLILYLHTIFLVFFDNFQIQHHATTFVMQDIISSVFFLVWMMMNVIQLSDCSKRQLTSNRNDTQSSLEKPFCKSIPCSIYLAPSIGSFMAMFTAIGLAAAAFRKINFYKIPRFIRDRHSTRQANYLSHENISSNKPTDPSLNIETTNSQIF